MFSLTQLRSKALSLTLLGRALLLLCCLLLSNAICWVLAGVLFGRKRDTQPILSLALLAWVRRSLPCRIFINLKPNFCHRLWVCGMVRSLQNSEL